MFGGSRAYSTNRGGVIQSSGKSRNQRLLLSASPYHCAAASRIAGKQFGRQRPSNSSSTTPSPSGIDSKKSDYWAKSYEEITKMKQSSSNQFIK